MKNDHHLQWIFITAVLGGIFWIAMFFVGCSTFGGDDDKKFTYPDGKKDFLIICMNNAQAKFQAHGRDFTWNGKWDASMQTVQPDGSALVWYGGHYGWGAIHQGRRKAAYTIAGLGSTPRSVFFSQDGYISAHTAEHEAGRVLCSQYGIHGAVNQDPVLKEVGIW